jgi:hypothetical protein
MKARCWNGKENIRGHDVSGPVDRLHETIRDKEGQPHPSRHDGNEH